MIFTKTLYMLRSYLRYENHKFSHLAEDDQMIRA